MLSSEFEDVDDLVVTSEVEMSEEAVAGLVEDLVSPNEVASGAMSLSS